VAVAAQPTRTRLPVRVRHSLPRCRHGGTCSLRQRKTRRKNDAEMTRNPAERTVQVQPAGTGQSIRARSPSPGFLCPASRGAAFLRSRVTGPSSGLPSPSPLASLRLRRRPRDFVAFAAVRDVFLAGRPPMSMICRFSRGALFFPFLPPTTVNDPVCVQTVRPDSRRPRDVIAHTCRLLRHCDEWSRRLHVPWPGTRRGLISGFPRGLVVT
jgi:hypothetical protein